MIPHNNYVLDTNVFVTAFHSYYAFDIVPTFWSSLSRLADEGRICSVEPVRDELSRQEDKLKRWASSSFSASFRNADEAGTVAAYGELMRWSQTHPQYLPKAKADFADQKNADAFVIAYAKATGFTVVTQETSSPDSKAIIKIPDVCRAFQIRYCNTFEMLRILGVVL